MKNCERCAQGCENTPAMYECDGCGVQSCGTCALKEGWLITKKKILCDQCKELEMAEYEEIKRRATKILELARVRLTNMALLDEVGEKKIRLEKAKNSLLECVLESALDGVVYINRLKKYDEMILLCERTIGAYRDEMKRLDDELKQLVVPDFLNTRFLLNENTYYVLEFEETDNYSIGPNHRYIVAQPSWLRHLREHTSDYTDVVLRGLSV